jgi:amino acid permease
MANSLPPQQNTLPTPPPLTPEQVAARKAQEQQTRTVIITVSAIAVVVLALLITAIYFLLRPETPADVVSRIRDIFIIVVGLETLIIGVALVVLLIQLASLINLLQNEIRPIIQATNETVNTLRGTAEFLGENLVEPVIKLNSYLASIQRVLELMGLKRK